MTGFLHRLDGYAQRAAASAMGRFPAPPALHALGRVRARLAEQLLLGRRDELARAHLMWQSESEARRDEARQSFGRVAEQLLDELRARVVDEVKENAPRLSPLALVARLDGLLPTDAMEHIDDPAFPEARRTAAMAALDRLNRGFGSYVRFAAELKPLLTPRGDGKPTVLDIASGHAGFALALAEQARDEGRPLRVIASDLRPEYLAAGRRTAEARGLDVEFHVADALHLDRSFSPGEIDVITCTQTLHHFGPALTAGLIAESLRTARRGLVFIDPARALMSLVLLGAVSFVAARDKAFFHDATLTIRKCFVPEELALVARCAPGGEALEASFFPPGFNLLRTRV